ncbi:MAG TPA: hypothetical protein VFQ97_03000 [Gallionella sp.]|nr:hypothetical protein [Gallionella sp.]
MTDTAPFPPTPASGTVASHLADWQNLENYRLQEQSLSLLFHQLCPSNTVVEHVLLKVSALNDFYSTNIFDTYSVAKHIVSLGIDHRLASSDVSLVNEIALVTIKGKQRNFYSFATKFCSHHQADVFPIFDSYVEKMLCYFEKCDSFSQFAKPDLRDYGRFVEVVHAFRTHYRLEQFSLREIDIYLWLEGKKYFRPSHHAA